MSKLQVVVGGQYGSEAKGHVTQRLAEKALRDGNVEVIRVAGPNAGHTGHDKDGKAWALRQVPVAAVVDTSGAPKFTLAMGIAAGSEIDLPVLLEEIDSLEAAGLLTNKTLWVSEQATMITPLHKDSEVRHNLTGRVGSTGKGIGAARADRLMREAMILRNDMEAQIELGKRNVAIVGGDPHSVWSPLDSDWTVIIEGTQGYGLGLHAGFYPQCTSSDCRAIDFMAMAGVHPWRFDETEVWVVARVFPIRVAGNSGHLKGETTWEALGLPPEHTTVTKKVRRVGEEDWNLVAEAVMANGGPADNVILALTMLDQKFPEIRDFDLEPGSSAVAPAEIRRYIQAVEQVTGAQIGLIGTGPNSVVWKEIEK